MKSIKPGRGPSLMGGVVCIFMALFGIGWTAFAFSMGGGLFSMFGLVFVGVAVVSAIYNFKNATGKNRYSQFDITDGDEEPDPLNERFGAPRAARSEDKKENKNSKNKFCPYCGAEVGDGFAFCNNCGRKLP